MKYFTLIRRNMFRKRGRAMLTLALLSFVFFFVSFLMSMLESFDTFTDAGEGSNRIVVQSAISLANLLPFSYEQKLRQLPGVVDVCKLQWIGAYWKDKRNFFPNFAIDHAKLETVFPDYKADPQQVAAWKADRRGALVGKDLVDRFHWKIGDRITLKRQIFPYDAELTIRGIYSHPVNGSSVYYHMDYHSEAMRNFGQVGTFWIKVRNARDMAPLSQQIDAMFKNSDYPTETFTEKEFQANFISMMGNIKLLFRAISGCAIVMVILLAAITMSMSARERVTEIAVLKAIGYPKPLVLSIMLAEFTMLTVLGGVLGTFGARLIFTAVDLPRLTSGMIMNFAVSYSTIGIGCAIAVLVGVLAGGLPAFRASSLSVVDGLRRVV
jgi:putative ABC transport system permease protein